MHEISQKLATWTDPYTGDNKRCTPAELAELKQEAYDFFWTTEVGQKLVDRGVNIQRFTQAFFDRFGTSSIHPAVPFLERMLEVGQDLLVELPEPVAPLPPKSVVAATPAAARETPKASAEAQKFSHLYNEALLTHGIASLRPAAGFVTIRVGTGPSAKAYRYSVEENDRLLEECLQLNLIS